MLDETTVIATPDELLNDSLAWAAVGPRGRSASATRTWAAVFVAGWGPSGRGPARLRWFFGGDAAINCSPWSALGRFEPVAEGLRFLARYQREDGKLPHEIFAGCGPHSVVQRLPVRLLHADTTPFWLLALGRHWRASADRKTLEELWPAARRAWAWCRSADTDGNGLIENTAGGLGAIEVGEIGKDIREDVYLAAVSVAGARAMGELAEAMGDAGLAAEAAAQARKGRRRSTAASGSSARGTTPSAS